MSNDAQSRTSPRSARRRWIVGACSVTAMVVATVVIWLVQRDDATRPTADPSPGGAQLEQYPVPRTKDLKNVGAKAKQAKITQCDALDGGGWIAQGTVTNTGEQRRGYAITVFFMEGTVPINYAQTSVKVDPGASVPWVAEKVFGTDKDLTCTIVAVG